MEENKENVPNIRFPGFTGPWEKRKLGEIAERITRKNTELESTLPLTISAQYGLVDQITFFNKRVASKDVSSYYLLKKGEFAYNKSYSEGYPWGVVKRLERYENGVLSTLYICFKLSDVNSNFLVTYYDTNNWYREVAQRAAEGARNHGLLNISADDFFDTELIIPKSKEEQATIGLFFKNIDNLITLHKRKLEHLQDKKKVLLQKMFPKEGEKFPELRFPGFTDPWEQRKLSDETYSIDTGKSKFVSKGDGKYEILGSTSVIGYDDNYDYEGDFLLTARVGANAGELYRHFGKVKISDNTVFIQGENLEFTFYMLMNFDIKKLSFGTGQPLVKASELKELKLMFPKSNDEKIQIGNFFYNLDNLITLHQRKLEHLKQQKKGLLQQMFI